jgi:tRNA nucleotidyltransferase (CCA-adding enzyme)
MDRPPLALPDEVVAIATRLEQAGHETWCVGGAIRDALLGAAREDVDLATAARPEDVKRLFRRTVPVGLKFGTMGVLDRHRKLHEVTTFRRDVTTDGRHAVVEYGVSLDDDLARRDFTINAIAYHPLRREWRDPFGGTADLAAGVIRAVGDPAARFREDYLRVLRALRFAARLDFEIEPATWAAARAAAPGLGRLSAERVRDEWCRSLETTRSLRRLVELWHEAGAAAVLLPELRRVPALAVDAPEPRDPVLLTAALCDEGVGVLERLRFSNADVGRLRRLAAAPPAPADDTPGAVRRWLSRTGPAADDVLALAALAAGNPPAWAAVVAGVRARGEPLGRGDLAVTGDDLRAAGVPDGPAMGRVLGALLETVLDEPGLNRREELLARARALVAGGAA